MSLPTDEQMRAAALAAYSDPGTIDIDHDAPVSRADGNPAKGAYVQAWVWVDDTDAEGL